MRRLKAMPERGKLLLERYFELAIINRELKPLNFPLAGFHAYIDYPLSTVTEVDVAA